ncbi:putative porin [Chitinivorax tropicus]|uniref:Putative porin n=1 Tax=Chitinivorax tropicus TaxID=714531 RepID=A0A840MRZ9_9PROT|nr:porin [Chitinivorax tropicus]MBB5019859.1 putative porin [Chitinivorax tropicus]
MNKKLVAALVAGAFVAPLAQAAESSNVTLYGIAQVAVSHWDNGEQKKHGVEDTGSRIGFKGEEALGGGMKAFFQIESSANLDQGGGTFASREGWVGLKGGFGGVQLGRGKSLFDLAQESFDIFNSNSTLINTLQVDGSYYRVSNTIRYTMPSVAGFSGGVEYGDMEGKGSNAAGKGVKPAFYSASLRYENGPLFVQGGYEHLKEVKKGPLTLTSSSNSNDLVAIPGFKSDAYILGAGYTLPFGLGLQGAYRHIEHKDGGEKKKRDTFLINAQQPFGPVTLKAGYVQAGNLKGCSGGDCAKGARWYTAAAEYAFSKRTWVYLEHAMADNKDNSGLFNTSAVDNVGSSANPAGKDNKTTSLGIIHLF